MKLKIEAMDWLIWLVIILPFAIGLSLWVGLEKGLMLFVLLPFIIMIKNTFLESQLTWKPEYSVGVAAMDEDHKKLIGLILEMFKALRKMPAKKEAERVLGELANYTKTHFDREEALMAKHGYPALEEHKKEHESMKAKVAEFRSAIEEDEIQTSKELLNYLQDWLINHINSVDKQYSQFLNDKGET